jgi:hypothetical protein
MKRVFAIVAVLALSGFGPGQQTPTGPPNPIDAWFTGYWSSKGAKPAGPATDLVFFRRVTLDLFGRLPTPDEIRAFTADKAPDKRAKLVERMLVADECAEFLSDVWLDALIDHQMTQQDFGRADMGPLRRWLRTSFHEDVPYDKIVRALLSDRGSRREFPAVNYSLKHLGGDPVPVKLAVMSARLFLGKDIRCAQCHDHPFGDMTQQEFWGYMEFFRPLRNSGDLIERKMPPAGPKRDDLGEMRGVKPRFLDGREPAPDKSLGETLADFTLTTAEKDCSRALIDRTWRQFFGRRLLTTPTEKNLDELAARLAAEFEREGWSLRKLLRTIVTSKAYQMDSKGREADRALYAAGPLKPMGPIQFMRVYTDVFNLHDVHREMYQKIEASEVAGEQFKDPEVVKLLFYGWARELLLPKGRDPEETPGYGTPRMAMKFMNNQRIQSMINAYWSPSMLGRIMSKKYKAAERIDEIFLSIVNRPPSRGEREEYVDYVEKRASWEGKKPFEDVLWVLLNSSEFLFIH